MKAIILMIFTTSLISCAMQPTVSLTPKGAKVEITPIRAANITGCKRIDDLAIQDSNGANIKILARNAAGEKGSELLSYTGMDEVSNSYFYEIVTCNEPGYQEVAKRHAVWIEQETERQRLEAEAQHAALKAMSNALKPIETNEQRQPASEKTKCTTRQAWKNSKNWVTECE